ncbi:hypothetical protein [Streptomyces sp. NBC_01433]|uniref:hypothetical protein n=1 Tax=Streptomyces sp. NBC_01433 TaxID=2903864 RepID=UPI002B1CB947|nr:hypothetical protein [Streptomyces sp. NBC_01433]
MSPLQRFGYLREVNTQADGLPPALVLVEVIAHQSKAVGGKLREWSDRWAREAGTDAVEALAERRRGIAAPSRADPEVPRCLVVMVEPADDGSADVFVRHWVNPAPGYWEPVAGEVERATLDALAGAVDRAIGSGEARWADVPELENEPPVQVEFVLPSGPGCTTTPGANWPWPPREPPPGSHRPAPRSPTSAPGPCSPTWPYTARNRPNSSDPDSRGRPPTWRAAPCSRPRPRRWTPRCCPGYWPAR